jgi:type II secretory pathway pseudopilin PulG
MPILEVLLLQLITVLPSQSLVTPRTLQPVLLRQDTHFMQYRSKLTTMRAFTLVETVVVIGILVIVGVALSSTIVYFYKTNTYVIEEGNAVQSAQNGLIDSMKDLREASYGDDGSYPIASVATSSITYYADINGDGSDEMITYYLSGGTLFRNVTHSTGNPPTYIGQTPATTTIATYIVNGTSTPIFQYYDDSGNLLSAPINPFRSPAVYTLTGSATLRNLRN